MSAFDQILVRTEHELQAARAADRDDVYEIAEKIHTTAPEGAIGAAVKLRLLCDKNMGVAVGVSDEELTSLDQLLDYVQQKAAFDVAFKEAYESWQRQENERRASRATSSDIDLLTSLATRRRLVDKANAKENSDETIGEEALNNLVNAIGKEVAEIDHQVADTVCQSASGIIGQVELLESLTNPLNPYTVDDRDHDEDCVDRLVTSIKVGIERLGRREVLPEPPTG